MIFLYSSFEDIRIIYETIVFWDEKKNNRVLIGLIQYSENNEICFLLGQDPINNWLEDCYKISEVEQ